MDKLLEEMNKFKEGQKVFVYSSPNHVTNPDQSPVWEAEVLSVSGIRTLATEYGADELKETIRVTVTLESDWDSFSRDSKDIFLSFDEAKAYAADAFNTLFERRAAYTEKLNQARIALENETAETVGE